MGRHRRSDEDDLPKAPINLSTLGQAAHLLGYVRPYWLKLAAALFSLAAGSLAGLAFPWLAGNLVDAAFLRLTHQESGGWLQDVNLVAVGLIVVLAFQAAFAFLRAMWFIEVGERSLADLRRDTFARLVRLPMSFHGGRRVGELASRISADLANIRETIIDGIPHLLRQAVLLVGGVVLIAVTSLRLTGVMLVSVPVLMVIAVLFGNVIRRLARDIQDRLADSNVIVEESLQNIASVKAFANESFEEKRYRSALADYLEAALRGAFFEGAFISFIVFALFGSIVLVLWYGATLVLDKQMTVGALTRFMLLTVYVAGAVGGMAGFYSQLQRMLGASTRVRELLGELPESGNESAPPLPLSGDVRFENVEFSYPSRPDVAVLQGVSLEARAGQRIALVGPSGAGKSTLVSLLLRFYEPSSGRILIDGRDARDYDLHALRSRMAVAPQDVILFGGTIAENIAYGKPGATPEEIEGAARQANAHDFILAFPDGYATLVGERGVQLSGGQRQRVAIARAILRDPAILLLDEATSSLDYRTEQLVMQALDRLMQGRTAFVIAHRLSTVRGADCIFVLKEGRVVESGSHAELMQRPEGLYRTLSLLQPEHADHPNGVMEEPSWPITPLTHLLSPPRS
jgi:ABC-type multidrug transport system fused ATPase/permease subunit